MREGVSVRESKGEEGDWKVVGGRRRAQRDSIATFFFTHFPESFDERSMRGVFQRWGRVVDLFIPRRRNKVGWRFGFVKMAGVHDPEHLARRIDQMFIGNMKLHVNVPRFGKEEPRNKKRNEVPYVRVQKGFQGSVRPTIKPEVKAEKLDHWEAHLVTNLRKGAT